MRSNSDRRRGTQFVTPLSVPDPDRRQNLAPIFPSLTDESEIGHLRLAQDADLVVVAPATADMLAKMADGFADDLASTAPLLATGRPVLIAPAMNHLTCGLHDATRANLLHLLKARGVNRVAPITGALAERGETGPRPHGRAAGDRRRHRSQHAFGPGRSRAAPRGLVTSGPTHEAIDPVRWGANRSSGKQGHAIAAAAGAGRRRQWSDRGPDRQRARPPDVTVRHIKSAQRHDDSVRRRHCQSKSRSAPLRSPRRVEAAERERGQEITAPAPGA